MSQVVDINELKKQFEASNKAKDLKVIAETQHALIEKLQAEIVELKKKANKPAPTLRVSSEEIICLEQIEILRGRSNNRELSLDEVKRLDILIKNLRLIREQATQVISSGDYSDVEEADLVAIASSSSEDR